MNELEVILKKAREKAIEITKQKLGKGNRNVITLMLAILTEIYSLEYLYEQLLRVSNELMEKQKSANRQNQLNANQPR